ncbi:hypothetical protein WIW90_07905 [Sulfolobaceae archaeon RB850M]
MALYCGDYVYEYGKKIVELAITYNVKVIHSGKFTRYLGSLTTKLLMA